MSFWGRGDGHARFAGVVTDEMVGGRAVTVLLALFMDMEEGI